MRSREELIQAINEIDWEFNNSDTQYLSHNIHRYSGKFIPQIARSTIELMTDPEEIVLDPYLGSGTTALEAMLLGRKCIGVDLNPLAILISQVKNTVLSEEKLSQFRQKLLSSVSHLEDGQMSIMSFCDDIYKGKLESPEDSDRYHTEWNKKWYQDHVLKQLIMIYDIIDQIPEIELQRIAKVAFSDILRKSSNASSRYPNVMFDKNHKTKGLPLKSFTDSFNDVIDKLIGLSKKISNSVYYPGRIIQGNNTNLHLDNDYVDAIITHPPYIAAVPYAEYGCLSLDWLGYNSRELDAELTGGKRHRKDVAIRFEFDYNLMIKESFRVLKHGKYAFFMVGNPTANGQVVDLHEMTIRLAEQNGFEYLCTAKRSGINRRGNNMGMETLEFFVKP